MPKINASDIPSYAGHRGTVQNARDELFDVDPARGKEGLTDEEFVEAHEDELKRPSRLADPSVNPVREQDQEDAGEDDGKGGQEAEVRDRDTNEPKTEDKDEAPAKRTAPRATTTAKSRQ